MCALDRDIFDILRASGYPRIIDYLDKELKNRDVLFIDVSLNNANHQAEIMKRISEAAQEMLLTLCNDDVVKIDISFNLVVGGSADGDRYTIMKCRNESSALVVVKTSHGFIFAKGGIDVVDKVLNEVLNNIKSDIITAEALARLCGTMEC